LFLNHSRSFQKADSDLFFPWGVAEYDEAGQMIASTGRPVTVFDTVTSQWSKYSFRISLRSFCTCQSWYAVIPIFFGWKGAAAAFELSSFIVAIIGSPVTEVVIM
jgi:hypothetical protein